MASEIRFSESEAEFSFRSDGVTFQVRTETAPDSFARVIVEEVAGPPQTMEPEEDE